MRNLLIGNGINIQFNRTDYSAQQIVLRILKNCDRDDFPTHIIVNYPYLLKNYIGQLFLEARTALEDGYDDYVTCRSEKESLNAFKQKYKSDRDCLRITDIAFEDYYLVHDLACHKMNFQNPKKYYIGEAMRIAYLYAIYNDGKLNLLYKQYPEGFVRYLTKFNKIFTTNYDKNLELATNQRVYHIHGQFDKKSDVYSFDSLRNKLPDAPIKKIDIDENYFYLYSNALTTHCGSYKEFQIKQRPQANNVIAKMAQAYKNDLKIRSEIDGWTKESNKLTANMGYAIQLKASNPELEFLDDYHFGVFKNITGTIEILGLSPWNDFHIFEAINSSKIEKCIYYYYDEKEGYMVESMLPELCKNKLQLLPVKKFWEDFNEK